MCCSIHGAAYWPLEREVKLALWTMCSRIHAAAYWSLERALEQT